MDDGLNTNTVTSSDSRSKFPCRHQEWEVPWNNLSDNTDRLTKNQTHHTAVQNRSNTFVCTDQTCIIPEVADRIRNIDRHCLTDRFSVIHGLNLCQPFLIFFYAVSNLIKDCGTFFFCCLFPFRKCFPCCCDSCIDIFFGSLCALCKDFTVCRIGTLVGCSVRCRTAILLPINNP